MGKQFLGRGWKFPVAIDATTGRILMSEYEEDIAEAIRIIIWTSKGERVMRPGFGCGIQEYVFDSTDYSTLRLMEQSIQEALMQWEPRVHQVQVSITVDAGDVGLLNISVQYVVRSTNNLYNQVYPFYIQEGSK